MYSKTRMPNALKPVFALFYEVTILVKSRYSQDLYYSEAMRASCRKSWLWVSKSSLVISKLYDALLVEQYSGHKIIDIDALDTKYPLGLHPLRRRSLIPI